MTVQPEIGMVSYAGVFAENEQDYVPEFADLLMVEISGFFVFECRNIFTGTKISKYVN